MKKEEENNDKKEIIKRKEMLRELEKSLNGFKSTQFAFTNDYNKKILFDSVNKIVGIIDLKSKVAKKYRFKQVVSVERLNPIEIKVTVEDDDFPVHIFNFINSVVQKNSVHYKHTVDRVNHWQGLLEEPMIFIKNNSRPNRQKAQSVNQQQGIQMNSGLIGCVTLIVIVLISIVLIASCGDSGGSNYQPGDFDFDGDSGDYDDAVKFLEWKMKQDQ